MFVCTLSRLAEALIWMQALKQTVEKMAPLRSLWKLTSSMPSPQPQVNTHTHKHRCFWILIVPFVYIVLIHSSFYHSSAYRLLLMEEYYDRVLVHAVTVWYDQQIWKRIGAPSHHDTSEPQGGSGVWVCLQFTRLWRKETNPMHCVNADQRDVFFSLMSSLVQKTSAPPAFICNRKAWGCVWGNLSLHISGRVDVMPSCKRVIIRSFLCGVQFLNTKH